MREAYDARIRVRCTDCKYCQPCPQGVEIPKIFSQYNDLAVFDHVEGNRKRYAKLIEGQADAAGAWNAAPVRPSVPSISPLSRS